ncbi:ETS-related transcription factor Elf-5 [Apis mellifera caucasica]|uniref:ETS-related transcription factor Elf-5 n=1 Tax=Apis mellifera TaxID=7460 RepID=A0A7M7L4Q5_APIME|nr:ETS-related transcription factor Elf-5 [Apis mellifera]KAG6800669.1 ETS-related transcription factor Elf-5 [Apis mellifera caucasica]KAG9433621.1 ETS-related transcription factor Elf-5 [Apis mellifera carnica]|eukprot:XP_026296476.1 ETS-related transcription factor Elf-5 [Apis mellifera]
MDLFDNYNKTLEEVYPSLFYPNEDDDHSVLDMDTLVTLKTNATRSYEPVRKKFYFGDENNEIDGTGWLYKPTKNWCQEETINWLMTAASTIGQPYSLIQHSLAVPGNELITFTKDDFKAHDPAYGDKLYDLLPPQHMFSPLDTIHPHFEDEYTRINSSSSTSDAESDNNSIDVSTTKRSPGRPRILKPKKNATSQGKLWEFIRDLLRNRETCPSLICWEDYSQAKFRFVKSDEVAKRWGSRKGNTKMTYEKLSRAMRYYYKSKIFQPVLGKRLVYQFGPNAKGWQTDNPNFRR